MNNADALTYSHFVQVAYDVYNANKTTVSPTQAMYGTAATHIPAGYKLLYNIHMKDFIIPNLGKVIYYGFVAQSIAAPTNYVIAIRGTQTAMEWWDNFHLAPTPCQIEPNTGSVCTGFWDIYNTLAFSEPGDATNKKLVIDTIKSPTDSPFDFLNTATSVVLAGHSLGGALITLYGLHLAASKTIVPQIYSYASPCVGDALFCQFYNNNIPVTNRVYNRHDLVPQLVQLTPYHYQHVNSGVCFDSYNYPIKRTIGCLHTLPTYSFLLGDPISVTQGCVKT